MSASHDSIILIGPPATGKSAVGEQLARALNKRFYDTDALVEQAHGKTVSEIFASEGESRFRQYETEALECLQQTQTQKSAMVVATGGGSVLKKGNRELLRRLGGFCVYLRAGIEAQTRRATRDDNRPLLSKNKANRIAADQSARYHAKSDSNSGGANHDNADNNRSLRDTLQRLNVERAPLYEEIADITVDTDDRSIDDVVRQIAETASSA